MEDDCKVRGLREKTRADGVVMRAFSRRTGWDVSESAFAGAVRRARAEGRVVSDLTVSNPTVCGFTYAATEVLGALSDPRSMAYDVDPRGMIGAREAVCGYYRDLRADVAPAQVLMTASTSEAYGYLFRLLCDAGDSVLVPQPGYPLFDYLADVEDVRVRGYPLFHDFGWWVDFAELERIIDDRTKAVLVVHPANPTGHWTERAERARLRQMCARHGLALIVDEVFLDYGIADGVRGEPAESFAGEEAECLTFVLSGLSKVCGLPQMKIGWMAVLGPPEARDEALDRLEVIADTFLSVNTPGQVALPTWLAGRGGLQRQILARLRENLHTLGQVGLEHWRPQAGWSVVARLPGSLGGAEEALEERGVIVHPGRFYGLPGHGRVVLSLLGPAEEFERGVRLLAGAPDGVSGLGGSGV